MHSFAHFGAVLKEIFMSNIIEITDFEAPDLDVYSRLNEVQLLIRQETEK